MNSLKKDLLFVGGGPQTTITVAALIARRIYRPSQIAILDPSPLMRWLLERFHDCRTHCLRSGAYDHLDLGDPDSLIAFAERHGRSAEFVTADRRPLVSLFGDYCKWFIRERGLERLRLEGAAEGLRCEPDGTTTVGSCLGDINAERVVLALGAGAPAYPAWAVPHRTHPRVIHVFDRKFERSELPPGARITIVGGGNSAIQLAVAFGQEGHHVTLLTRSEIIRGAGTDPAIWNEAKCAELCAMPYADRFDVLRRAGDRGTIPDWEADHLRDSIARGEIVHRLASVMHLTMTDRAVELTLADGTHETDVVVLATGFENRLPPWALEAAEEHDLPLLPNGHPVLSDELEWGRCIYVMGPFAAPVVGPYAGNIIGGRSSAERVIRALSGQLACT